jgi:hypothetical protein
MIWPRAVLEVRPPDHIRYPFFDYILLGLAHIRYLRNGVHRHRQVLRRDMGLATEGMQYRGTALLHAGRGECRASDQITHRVDVRHIGLEVCVHADPTVLHSYTGTLHGQPRAVRFAALREQHRIGTQLFAAGKVVSVPASSRVICATRSCIWKDTHMTRKLSANTCTTYSLR